eukprot:jgi/Chlat1/4726/Chrsp30S04774
MTFPTVGAAGSVGNGSTPQPELLCMGFNQDYGCFAVGTDEGFRIYNVEPFEETFRRGFSGAGGGGIGHVEMLFRCNILAVVGGGRTPRFPPNKVMIWDDHQSRCIGELSFRSEVRAVRLRRERIVVVLEQKIYVYNFSDLKLLQQIDTMPNPRGLCALSPAASSTVLVCPGLNRGQVRIELYDQKKTKFIVAHTSALACIALTMDGSRLATCSDRGTLVRIFDTAEATLLQEVRRGADRAMIYSISFAPSGQWLAVSSDKGTIHVFALHKGAVVEDPTLDAPASDPMKAVSPGRQATPVRNAQSALSLFKGLLPKYFSSEWSFAQFRLPEETKSIVAFGPQRNTIIIVSADGSFHKCAFDPLSGGECVQQSYTKFMKSEDEEMPE